MPNLKRPIALLLSILLTLTPVMTVQAGMVGTDTLLESAQTRDSLQQLLGLLVRQLEGLKSARRVRWSIDVDPADTY